MNSPAELAQFMFDRAKTIVESGRQALPMLAVVKGDEITFVGIPWRTAREKAVVLTVVRDMLASEPAISAYAIVSECWVSTIQTKGMEMPAFKHMPRDDPKRQEALMVSSYNRDGTSAFLMADIKTVSNKIRYVAEPTEMPDSFATAGQMVDFFKPEEVEH